MQQVAWYNDSILLTIGVRNMVDMAARYRESAQRLAAASQDRWDCERILKAAAEGVTRSRVVRIVRRPASEVDRLLGTMLKDGSIEAEVTYGRGRPLTTFWHRGKKGNLRELAGEGSPTDR